MLADNVGFDLLSDDLGRDVGSAIQFALEAGAVFPGGNQPLPIFRHALSTAIREIQAHPMGKLFMRYFRDDPLEGPGAISVAGVVEVKSYFQTKERLESQIARHIERSRFGLTIAEQEYSSQCVHIGHGPTYSQLRRKNGTDHDYRSQKLFR